MPNLRPNSKTMIGKLLGLFRNKQFHSLLGNLVTASLNVLTFAMLVRMLSLEDFGAWVIFITTYNILDQIRTGLLQSGVIKFYTGVDSDTAKKVAGAGWYISLLLTSFYILASGIVYFAAYDLFDDTWHQFLMWLGFVTLFSLPMNFATWILQAQYRFDKIIWIRIAQNGTYFVMVALLWISDMVSLSNVLLVYVASFVIASIYCMVQRWTAIRTVGARTREHSLQLYHFGKMIIGSNVSSSLISYTNNMVILTMLGQAKVALFSIPQKFIEVIEIVLRSFVATAQPTLSAAANRGDKAAVAAAYCRYTGTVTLLVIPAIVAMLIFTEPLIIILASKDYLGSAPVVRIVLACAVLWPIDRFNGVTLDMIGVPGTNFFKNISKMVLNIFLATAFVWLFPDIKAVAFAIVVHVTYAVVLGHYMLSKHLDIPVKMIWRYGWDELKRIKSMIFNTKNDQDIHSLR